MAQDDDDRRARAAARRTRFTGGVARSHEEIARFNLMFWQSQGQQAIFAAAWDMVREADTWRGSRAGQSGLQRSLCRVEHRGS